MAAIGQIKQLFNGLKAMQNPMAAIQMMANQNPQVAAALQLMQSGGNPETIFADQCKQFGVDPGEAMAQIRGILNG